MEGEPLEVAGPPLMSSPWLIRLKAHLLIPDPLMQLKGTLQLARSIHPRIMLGSLHKND